MNIIKCKNCGKEYGYEETGELWPGGKDREEACCPYCGTVGYSTMTSGFIYVYKLDDKNNKE